MSNGIEIQKIETKPLVAKDTLNLEDTQGLTQMQADLAKENVGRDELITTALSAVAQSGSKKAGYDRFGKPNKDIFIKEFAEFGVAFLPCLAAITATAGSAGAAAPTLAACGPAAKQLFDIINETTKLFKSFKTREEVFRKVSQSLPVATWSCTANEKTKKEDKRSKFLYGNGLRNCSDGSQKYTMLMDNIQYLDGVRAMAWSMYATGFLKKIEKNLNHDRRVFKDDAYVSWNKLYEEYSFNNTTKHSADIACANGFLDFKGAPCHELHFWGEIYVDASALLACNIAKHENDPEPAIREGLVEFKRFKTCFERCLWIFATKYISQEEMGFWDLVFKGSQLCGGLGFELVYRDECEKVVGIAINTFAKKPQSQKKDEKKSNFTKNIFIIAIILIVLYIIFK